MRKVAMIALASAALAWSGAASASSSQKAQDKASSASVDVKQEAQSAKQGAQEAGQKASAKAHEQMARTESSAKAFEGKNNFQVKGKISKVSRDRITVSRQNLPPATLDVSKETKIEVNGNASSIDQLRQGQDVQASFNLRGDKPLAVEIKANKAGK